MPQKSGRKNPLAPHPAGPVRVESPLYRILQMIASAIAKDARKTRTASAAETSSENGDAPSLREESKM
jgi:hypothetical protein